MGKAEARREAAFGVRLRRERQARERVVRLAQQYRVACDRYDAEGMAVEQGEGDLARMEEAGKEMEHRREVLFTALEELEELEMLEGEGP